MKAHLVAAAGTPASRVIVGYPTGFSVTLPFQVSLLRLLFYELSKPANKRYLAGAIHASGLYVGDNRQQLTRRFLAQKEADWLLQVDTDIEFPPNLLEVILELAAKDPARKVLACSVPLGLYRSCAFRQTDKPGVWQEILEFPEGVIECDGIATAVCLVHRSVFEKIAEEFGQTWWEHLYVTKNPDAPKREQESLMQGEDLAFCIRAKAVGFRIFCGFVTKIKHYKTRALSHDAMARETAEAPAEAADGPHSAPEPEPKPSESDGGSAA